MNQTDRNLAFNRDQVDKWMVKGFEGIVNILEDRINDPLPMNPQVLSDIERQIKRLLMDVQTKIEQRRGK